MCLFWIVSVSTLIFSVLICATLEFKQDIDAAKEDNQVFSLLKLKLSGGCLLKHVFTKQAVELFW